MRSWRQRSSTARCALLLARPPAIEPDAQPNDNRPEQQHGTAASQRAQLAARSELASTIAPSCAAPAARAEQKPSGDRWMSPPTRVCSLAGCWTRPRSARCGGVGLRSAQSVGRGCPRNLLSGSARAGVPRGDKPRAARSSRIDERCSKDLDSANVCQRRSAVNLRLDLQCPTSLALGKAARTVPSRCPLSSSTVRE